MIKGRRLPCRRVVAGIASLRESARHVIRIGCALEIFQVTRHARDGREVVVVVYVAIGTLPRRHGVSAGQRKIHHRVIEGRRGPTDRGMALRAV